MGLINAYTYSSSNGTTYSLTYVLQGNNLSCPIGNFAWSNGGVTVCLYSGS